MPEEIRERSPCGCIYDGDRCVKECPDQGVLTYVARKPCGCVVAVQVAVTDGSNKRDVARELSSWVREGYTVENRTVGWVRHGGDGTLFNCAYPALKRRSA